jgi:hypothetical protein
MKTIIQWETPCRLLHADGYRCQIERRTFAQFKKIIGATRDWPLLLDVHSEEADDVNRAIDGFRLGRTFHKHLDALRRRAGWARCAIWPASYALPDDRTARAAFMYSPAELAEGASSTAYDHEFLEPDAGRGRAQVSRCKANAPKGGRAAAHYTDAVVEQAFAEYKQRNPPDKTAWDAAQCLIRSGQPLDGYKTVTGPWNRIGRMAGAKWGRTRDEWFDGL